MRMTLTHSRRRFLARFGRLGLAMLFLTEFAGGSAARADDHSGPTAVYTLTNAAEGNGLVVYQRNRWGRLSPTALIPTGGLGSGGGLHNQGAIALSPDGNSLFVVNAGNDTISTFWLKGRMPRLTQVVPSGGHIPNSLTTHGDLLYVLHTGGDQGGIDSIVGFRITPHGLRPLPGSARPLSGLSTGPAQIGFSPDGRVLIVTERMSNKLTTYVVGRFGYAGAPNVQHSNGTTPFGFGFTPDGKLVVSEANGGAPGASSVSLYSIGHDGNLTSLTASLPTQQTAACWITVDPHGRFAYSSNTPAATLTGMAVDESSGSLHLLNPNGGVSGLTGPGSAPTDGAILGGRWLYVLGSGNGEILGFSIARDGTLTFLDLLPGFSTTGTGIAVR